MDCKCPIEIIPDEEGSAEEEIPDPDTLPYKCMSDFSILESAESGFVDIRSRTQVFDVNKPPDIEHEVNVAKSLLQQGSSLTGDNLFDHLSGVIKRVVADKPDNVVDYFEEMSHNLRMQKFHIGERFTWTPYIPVDNSDALAFFNLAKIQLEREVLYKVCDDHSQITRDQSAEESSNINNNMNIFERNIFFKENVTRLHLYWSLCGFGMQTEEVMMLAYALQRIQQQPMVEIARFWGKMYTTEHPYYIVEVKLTQCELDIRLNKMREEMMEKMSAFRYNSEMNINVEIDLILIPGTSCKDYPEEDLAKMVPVAAPIPIAKPEVNFDIPPEAVGSGTNRLSYFVVTSLLDNWIELPIVTPKQIQVSRQIKKYLTGDLEADISSYPQFPGKEKHYLRTLIARITAGTYIAPRGYYRKLTKKERMALTGDEIDEEEELADFEMEGEEEDEEDSNDAFILENEKYKPEMDKLINANEWVHIRSGILRQGRVLFFDEEKARKALEREARLRMKAENEFEDEEEEDEKYDEEDYMEDFEPLSPKIEKAPPILSSCSFDFSDQDIDVWSPRLSSCYNRTNQLVIMRSNLWPGAFSFTYNKFADCIYFGWGNKYVARNIDVSLLPPIQYEYSTQENKEATDPTVEMEKAYHDYWLRKQAASDQISDEHLGEEDEFIC